MLNTALDARVSPETLRKIESGRVATPAFPTIAAIAHTSGPTHEPSKIANTV